MAIMLATYIGTGVILAVVSVPLIQKRIGPNNWYGVRIPQTLNNTEVWYDVNAFVGKRLFVVGILAIVVAAGLYLIPAPQRGYLCDGLPHYRHTWVRCHRDPEYCSPENAGETLVAQLKQLSDSPLADSVIAMDLYNKGASETMTRLYLARTWIDPRQKFRASQTHGIGSFASLPIRSGEVVEIAGGVVMTEEEFCSFQTTTMHYNAIQIAENLHLVEYPEVTQERTGGSLNHSCSSNLWMADEVTLVANRDIVAGEELTVDYALFTVQSDWVLDLPCHCGSKICRHIITGNDWQLPGVQHLYQGHFSPFINARIERLGQH